MHRYRQQWRKHACTCSFWNKTHQMITSTPPFAIINRSTKKLSKIVEKKNGAKKNFTYTYIAPTVGPPLNVSLQLWDLSLQLPEIASKHLKLIFKTEKTRNVNKFFRFNMIDCCIGLEKSLSGSYIKYLKKLESTYRLEHSIKHVEKMLTYCLTDW